MSVKKTPIASRLHVGIFGNTNAGKSSLFNEIFGQDIAIVSEQRGTTTDPIVKAMELNPYGPIALIDTGGLDDTTQIGIRRVQKTRSMLGRTDLALYVADINDFDKKAYEDMVLQFDRLKIPHLLVFTKIDEATDEKKKILKEEYKNCIFTALGDEKSITFLKQRMGEELQKIEIKEETLIGDLLPINSTVVMVVPLDEAAPKGRLILPQVQFIRDCLDHRIKCLVTKETELYQALSELKRVDLVVTDSQVFKLVAEIVPRNIPLTSFSMLFANQKGDINLLMKGVYQIESLPENGRILMAEGCSHSQTHEDIGRVKIPNLLRKHTGKNLEFDFYSGYDFPDNLRDYHLIIHCGGCMLNKKAVQTRLWICQEAGVPVTNYGIVLAYLNGILQRCSEIFLEDNKGIVI